MSDDVVKSMLEDAVRFQRRNREGVPSGPAQIYGGTPNFFTVRVTGPRDGATHLYPGIITIPEGSTPTWVDGGVVWVRGANDEDLADGVNYPAKPGYALTQYGDDPPVYIAYTSEDPAPGSTTDHVGTTDNYDSTSTINFAGIFNFLVAAVLNFAGAAWNFTANTLWNISTGVTLRIKGPGKLQTCALVEVCGDMALCGDDVPVEAFTISDMELPEDVDGCGTVVIRHTDAGGDFQLSGMVARYDGQVICLINATAFTCLLLHLHDSSAPGNQLSLLDSHDMELRPGGGLMLWYSTEEDRWNLMTEARDDTSRLVVTQETHGFAVQNALYFNGTDWELADASDVTKLGIGVVCHVRDVDTFTVQFSGKIALLSGLTAGQYYFVSDTVPGSLVLAEPDCPSYSNPLLQATSATTGVVLSYRPCRVCDISEGEGDSEDGGGGGSGHDTCETAFLGADGDHLTWTPEVNADFWWYFTAPADGLYSFTFYNVSDRWIEMHYYRGNCSGLTGTETASMGEGENENRLESMTTGDIFRLWMHWEIAGPLNSPGSGDCTVDVTIEVF